MHRSEGVQAPEAQRIPPLHRVRRDSPPRRVLSLYAFNEF